MTPATSDKHDGSPHPSDDVDEPAVDIERRSIQGHEALVYGYEDEIFVEWHGARASLFGVRAGDVLKDADADISSPRIAEWVVTDITPRDVVGEEQRTGETRTFDRDRVERGLVVGNFATNLSDFARATVHAVGSWDTYDPASDTDSVVYRGQPYLTVVALGNNGRTYGLRYQYVVPEANAVTLWEEDTEVAALDDSLRDRLFSVVKTALSTAGYDVE